MASFCTCVHTALITDQILPYINFIELRKIHSRGKLHPGGRGGGGGPGGDGGFASKNESVRKNILRLTNIIMGIVTNP